MRAERDPQYLGRVGQTRRERVHYACPGGDLLSVEIVVGVNLATHPELGAALRRGELNRVTVPGREVPARVEAPMVVHDPAKRVMVLLLPAAYRVRELEERASLLLAMAGDREADVPGYALQFAVAYGMDELEAALGAASASTSAPAPAPGAERSPSESEITGVTRRRDLFPDEDTELSDEAAPRAAVTQSPKAAVASSDASPLRTRAGGKDAFGNETTRVTTDQDVAIERWMASGHHSGFVLEDDEVRLLCRMTGEELEASLSLPLRGAFYFHPVPTYGLIVLGVHAGSGEPTDPAPLPFFLDPLNALHRGILEALIAGVPCRLDVYDLDHLPVMKRPIMAPAPRIAKRALAAALAHIESLDTRFRSFDDAIRTFRAADFPRFPQKEPVSDEPSRVVAGVIAQRRVDAPDLANKSDAELIDSLKRRAQRLSVALEICRRAQSASLEPLLAALADMPRGDAVSVFPELRHFGDFVTPRLVDGLGSHKAFYRQGCALTLGVLRDERGLAPLAALLLREPTDVWREIARALGEFGAGAVMTLLAQWQKPEDRRPGEAPAQVATERVVWALAHVVSRGGRGAVETLAKSTDAPTASLAADALREAPTARRNDATVKGDERTETTVNRAFSRQFFQAMNRPDGEPLLISDADLLEEPSDASVREEGGP